MVLELVVEDVIDFLRSTYFFYFVMCTFILANITYREMVSKLKDELDYELNFKNKDEVWEMVNEERKKRNTKASVAWIAGRVMILCAMALLGIIGLRI